MRPQQQNRRMRGRNNNNNGGSNNNNNNHNHNRKGPNPLTRSYESNGPDVKIRGSAQQIAEKYTTLARDATSSGDRVMAENYLQHAEHYNRIIAAAQAQMPQPPVREQRNDFDDELDDDNEGMEAPQNQPNTNGQFEQPAQSQDGQQSAEGRDQAERRDRDFQGGGQREPREGREQREARGEGREPREPREPREGRERRPFRERGDRQRGDGSGPQPVIEGVPAEVAYGEAQAIQTPQPPAAEVRDVAPQPAAEHDLNGEAVSVSVSVASEANAAVAPADSEAQPAPRARRPRRPRTPKADAGEAPVEAAGEVEPAS